MIFKWKKYSTPELRHTVSDEFSPKSPLYPCLLYVILDEKNTHEPDIEHGYSYDQY